MTTTTHTRHVRFLGACQRCRKAGRPKGVRRDVEVVVTRTEIPTYTHTGALGFPRIRYTYSIDGCRVDSAERMWVECSRCVESGIAPVRAQVELRAVRGVVTEEKCGAKCRNATGPSCECSCGGANHGCGH